MKITLILGALNKEWEIYTGKRETKWTLVEISGTVLTMSLSFSVRV